MWPLKTAGSRSVCDAVLSLISRCKCPCAQGRPLGSLSTIGIDVSAVAAISARTPIATSSPSQHTRGTFAAVRTTSSRAASGSLFSDSVPPPPTGMATIATLRLAANRAAADHERPAVMAPSLTTITAESRSGASAIVRSIASACRLACGAAAMAVIPCSRLAPTVADALVTGVRLPRGLISLSMVASVIFRSRDNCCSRLALFSADDSAASTAESRGCKIARSPSPRTSAVAMLGDTSMSRAKGGLSDADAWGAGGWPLQAMNIATRLPRMATCASALPRRSRAPDSRCASNASAAASTRAMPANGRPLNAASAGADSLRAETAGPGGGGDAAANESVSSSRESNRSTSGTNTGHAATSLQESLAKTGRASGIDSDSGNADTHTRPRPARISMRSGWPAGATRASTVGTESSRGEMAPGGAVVSARWGMTMSAHQPTLGPAKTDQLSGWSARFPRLSPSLSIASVSE